MTSSTPNRLADATSPYLLQHAHNPVDWYPWGEEALTRARAEQRPILLSIGYAACHWCHVMERESFENETTAELMNELFVCIKVDREERPDLDELYMAATQAMNNGQGGWPMTVFLTPELAPIYAGTYFPPEDRWGRPGFPTLLHAIDRAWRERREEVEASAASLVTELARSWAAVGHGEHLERHLPRALSTLERELDRRHGGFGGAPKFPPHPALELLQRAAAGGDQGAREAARLTLEGMARGGIHDHLGGGFARYAVDAEWLVPHFEKMLSDNALLIRAYTEAHRLGDPGAEGIVRSTIGFLERELRVSDGGFASSLDADSEGEEGVFYTWTPDEVAAALGDPKQTELACTLWDITTAGHLDGRAVPNLLRGTLAGLAAARHEDPRELAGRVDEIRRRLLSVREERPRPSLDDKVISSWNGLAIGALAEAARAFAEPRWLELAEGAADFVLAALTRDGSLLRAWRTGRAASIGGFLDDHAFLVDSLIDLYEAGGGPRRLDQALALAEAMLTAFADPASGALFTTPAGHEPLPARTRERVDGATPSAPAVAARALSRLADHLERDDLRTAGRRAIEVDGRAIEGYPRAFSTALCVADRLARGAVEVAIVGDPAAPETAALHRATAAIALPDRAIAAWHRDDGVGDRDRPLLRGRQPPAGAVSAAFVCHRGTCRPPITEPEALLEALIAARDG